MRRRAARLQNGVKVSVAVSATLNDNIHVLYLIGCFYDVDFGDVNNNSIDREIQIN